MTTIYDAVVRHGLYLEGLKANQHGVLLDDVGAIFRLYNDAVRSLEVDSMGELTATALTKLIAERRVLAVRIYSKYTLKFLKFLEKFNKVEARMSALTIKELGDGLNRSVPLSEFGAKFSGNVWASIKRSTLPSSGDSFIDYIDNFGRSLISNIEKRIKFSVVNAETRRELLEGINGIKGKVLIKGGLVSRFTNAAKGMVDTIVQHVSSFVHNEVQSRFYDKYIWISIIDGSTTEVCHDRNGNIYDYGEGPLPPAHIRCRSRTAPYTGDAQKRNMSFYEWLTGQPDEIQQLVSDDTKSLDLGQYAEKLGSILKAE